MKSIHKCKAINITTTARRPEARFKVNDYVRFSPKDDHNHAQKSVGYIQAVDSNVRLNGQLCTIKVMGWLGFPLYFDENGEYRDLEGIVWKICLI